MESGFESMDKLSLGEDKLSLLLSTNSFLGELDKFSEWIFESCSQLVFESCSQLVFESCSQLVFESCSRLVFESCSRLVSESLWFVSTFNRLIGWSFCLRIGTSNLDMFPKSFTKFWA